MSMTQQAIAWRKWYADGVDAESQSGLGSSMENTKELREALPRIFSRHNVYTLTDIPCGDWHWMRHVDLSCIDYLGCDVVPELVLRLAAQFTSNKPRVRFAVLDAVNAMPRHSDLILCRDLLFHLSNANALRVLRNFRDSGSRLLLTTTFRGRVGCNAALCDGNTVGWRPVDVESAPFCLPAPLDVVQENDSPACLGRSLGLYDLAAWRDAGADQ